MASIIKTENLTHLYNEGTPDAKAAIHDINLEIEQGDFVAVIGHTGSGKSTLIQHFNGLLKPTSGKIYVCGKDIWESKQTLRQTRFEVGLVFQYPEYQLFEETCFKDIAFGPKNMGLAESEINNRVLAAADAVGLSEQLLEKSPFELSGGQKRRVAIAGVIAMQPKVLILDEPTAGLDPKGRDMVLNMIKSYHQQSGSTILLVSHSMEDTAKYANSVLVMNQSSVYDYGSVDQVFAKSEEIEKLGLSVPQVAKVFKALHEKYPQIPADVYTPERAKEVLLSQFGKQIKEGASC